MNAVVGVCSVGTEVVVGDQVDTNAAWLAQRLRVLGMDLRYHVAAGDDLEQLVEALRWLVDRSDAVVVGGGLGPTPDDLTREAVAALAGVPLESRADLEELIIQRFADYGVRMPAANLRQARVPRGAVAHPPVGTAPTFRLDVERGDGGTCVVYVLPGVPWEMHQLFERDVQPDLLERFDASATVIRMLHVTGMGESSVAEALEGLDTGGSALSYLAKGDEIQVRVTATAVDPEAAAALADPVVEAVRQRLGQAVVAVDDQRPEEVLVEQLRAAGQTVAIAESATGGLISSRLASVPGASDALRGAAVVYATDTKASVLGVPAPLLEEHGPVSDAVTRELAIRVRERFDADWGVAVTGVAGPTTQGDVPVGTVFWALADPDGGVGCWSRKLPGDREAVQRRLGAAALEALRRGLAAR